MSRCNARRVPMRELASIIGRAQSLRLAVPDTAFRLRASYVSLHGKESTGDGHGSWTRFNAQDRGSHGPRKRVVLSHPAIKDLMFLAVFEAEHASPPHLANCQGPECDHAHRRVSDGVRRFFTAGESRPGDGRPLRNPGILRRIPPGIGPHYHPGITGSPANARVLAVG